MIHSLAKRVASVFVLYGESSEEDADIYTYVCEAVIALLFNIAICLIIASLFGRVMDGIIFITVFAALRRYAGGHHAGTHFKCILTFSIIFIGVIVLMSVMSWFHVGNTVALLIATIACVGIVLLAPVEHANKVSGHEFGTRRKWISRILVSMLWLFCVIDFYILNSHLSLIVSFSMFSVFGSMAYAMMYRGIYLREEVTG